MQLPAEILGPGSEYEERRLALRKDWLQVVEAAKQVQVVDPVTCEAATQMGRLLHAAGREVESFYKPIKQQIDAMKKPVLAAENEDMAAIEAQKHQLGEQITAYDSEQRRLREAEEQRQREEAERQAREDALNRAIELEGAGDVEQAAAVLEEVEHSPVVIQSSAPAHIPGKVSKTTYRAEVTDAKALLKAVLDGKVPMAAVVINQSYLDKRAASDREGFAVPGVKLVKTAATHFRI